MDEEKVTTAELDIVDARAWESLADPTPWHRQKRMLSDGRTIYESFQAWSAFKRYCDMGEDRSLVGVGRACGKSRSLMERWSKRWAWQERSRAFDDFLDAEQLKAMVRARVKMAVRQAVMAQRCQKAARFLEEVADDLQKPTFAIVGGRLVRTRRKPNVSESARLLAVSSKLEQTVLGEPSSDNVASIVIHVECQKRPRFESAAESSDTTPKPN